MALSITAMDQIRIRTARPCDAEAIAEMMTQPTVYRNTVQPPHTTPEAWRKRLEANDPTGHQAL